jgi:hypothetical protein
MKAQVKVTEAPKRKRGRPMLRDLWAQAIWDQLWKVHPNGLTPKQLRRAAGLTSTQVQTGARYLRGLFRDEPDPPVVYVRRLGEWFIAPSWAEHTRDAIRSEYLQQAAARLQSAEQLLSQAKRAFPAHARQIRRVQHTAAYLRETTVDLIDDLEAVRS